MDFAELGVALEGMHYARIPHQHLTGETFAACLELTTDNPFLFTRGYDNSCRGALHSALYDMFSSALVHSRWIDAVVRLVPPYNIATSPLEQLGVAHGLVDVTRDEGVKRITLADAIAKGDLDADGFMAAWCEKRNARTLLTHGGHYISPDPITAEIIDTIRDIRQIESYLEIGTGTGETARAAQGADITMIERDPDVCDYLRTLDLGRVVEGNAFRVPLTERYDVATIGLPYELIPWFLEQRGASLRAGTLVVQSGCPAFFQFEHDWLMGRFDTWQWHHRRQEVGEWFDDPQEVQFGYQTAIVAGKDARAIADALLERGFTRPSYERVDVSSAEDVRAALRDLA